MQVSTVTGLNFDTTVLTSTRFVTVAQNKKKKGFNSDTPAFFTLQMDLP